MKHIDFGGNMRIAVCDLSTGDLDILLLDSEAEKSFDSYEDASEFFEDLGYDIDYISWMEINGLIREHQISAEDISGKPYLEIE